MTDTAAFWDRAAPRYAKRPISDTDAYEATLERVRAHLAPDSDVLELGCGTGTTALKLADACRSYTGTDVSGAMISIAKEKQALAEDLDAQHPGLAFRTAPAGGDTLSAGGFDRVLAFNLLHLLPDAEAALAEIHASLPHNGLFISKTPCIAGKWYLRPLIEGMRLIGKAPKVLYLSVDQLDRMVTDAGFEIVEAGLYPPSTPSRFIVARKP